MPITYKPSTLVLAVLLAPALAAAQTPQPPAEMPPPIAYSTAPWPGPTDSPLGQQIWSLVNEPAVSRDHWGIAVTTLDGTPVFGLNQGQLFRPASNTKLFTTATALALFGPNQRFETRVITSGSIDAAGTLHGDLRLEGRGDANFGEEDIPYVRSADRPKDKKPVTNIPDIEDLARKIAAKGIHAIQGDLIASDAYFAYNPYATDWSIDDALWSYGAPVTGLTIHDSEFDVIVTPAAVAGQPATLTTIPDDTPYYTLDNQITTAPGPGSCSCDSRLDLVIDEPARTIHLRGAIAPGHVPCTENFAMPDPTHFAGIALKAALERRGITVSGTVRVEHWTGDKDSVPGISTGNQYSETTYSASPQFLSQPQTAEESRQADDELARIFSAPQLVAPCANQPDPGPNPTPAAPGQTELATHAAPPLQLDLDWTNKVSDNLHAETFFRNLPSALCLPRTVRNSIRIRKQFLTYRAGIDPKDVILYDGSGLSGHDLIAPRATAQLLRFAATQPWFTVWKASLPVAGEDGTLGTRFAKSNLKDHIFAKTGTLGESRALSGYIDTASGKTLIFSIMIDTHPSGSADQAVMDKILAAIAAAN